MWWNSRHRFWLPRSAWNGTVGSEDCTCCFKVAGGVIYAMDTDFGVLFLGNRCGFRALSCNARGSAFTY